MNYPLSTLQPLFVDILFREEKMLRAVSFGEGDWKAASPGLDPQPPLSLAGPAFDQSQASPLVKKAPLEAQVTCCFGKHQ